MNLTPRQQRLFDVLKPYLAEHHGNFILYAPHVPGMLSALEAHMETRLTGLLNRLNQGEDGNE